MTFHQDAYDEFLIQNKVVGLLEDPITLRSGGKSYWYANFRTLLSDISKAEEAAEFIYNFTMQSNLKPTNFFAVPEGPKEFASRANTRLKKYLADENVVSAASLRSGYKTHGSPLDRYSVGPVTSDMKPVLIEDVTTTGNSSTEYIMLLQELGISPLAIVSMLNRQERRNDGRTVKELVEGSYNVPYLDMTAADRILPRVVELSRPKQSVIDGLRKELGDLGRYIVEIKI